MASPPSLAGLQRGTSPIGSTGQFRNMNSVSNLNNNNNTGGGGAFNFDSKQHTIDVLTQELNGARASAKRAQEEVALLRHQLGVMRGQLSAAGLRGANTSNMRPEVEEAWIIFCRSVLAMDSGAGAASGSPSNSLILAETAMSLSSARSPAASSHSPTTTATRGIGKPIIASPNSTILRSLHQGQDIDVPADCDYVQLSALAEACRQAQPHVHRLTIDLAEGSHAPFVNSILTSVASLQELSASRVCDTTMQAVLVPAISAHPELEVLELPHMAISDQGARHLKKALSERRILAEAGSASFLRPLTLDFSGCYFKEPANFTMYGGDVETLVLDNQKFFTFNEIRSALEACAASSWLTSLSVSGTMVDNRICTLLSDGFPQIVELNLVNCSNITHINLKHVTHLHTDGRRVVEFNCPSLEVMATPLTHFAPAIVNMPKLDEISFLNATLTKREMELLGTHCGRSLTVVKFLTCRLESLETLMRQLRRLEVLSLHSSKGVRDVDLKILFEPLVDVDLTDNFVLTDAVLDALARCPNLERLSLKRCQNITDVGIGKLESHPSLHYLNLLGVKKVSAAAVQRLVRISAQNAQAALQEQANTTVFDQAANVTNISNNNNAVYIEGEVVVMNGVGGGDQQQQDEIITTTDGTQQQQHQSVPPRQPQYPRHFLTSVIDVRHATAISTDAMIERADEEEKERARIVAEERAIERRRRTLAAFASTYDNRVGSPNSALRMKPSASPRFTGTATGSSAAAAALSMRSISSTSASQQNQQRSQQQNSNDNNTSEVLELSKSNDNDSTSHGHGHQQESIPRIPDGGGNVDGRPSTRDQSRHEKSVNFAPGTEL